MTRPELRSRLLLGFVTLCLALAPSALADKPDVLIKFDDGLGEVRQVDPQIKGLCLSPSDKKGSCDNKVIWRVTDGLGDYEIHIKPRTGEKNCFPSTSFPLEITSRGPAGQVESGAVNGTNCPRGTTWKYEVHVIDENGSSVSYIDPFIVIDD